MKDGMFWSEIVSRFKQRNATPRVQSRPFLISCLLRMRVLTRLKTAEESAIGNARWNVNFFHCYN